ncbi:MAG: NADH-quinone oxidoreductase subunit NuoF [bacterium]|nr:NADH-quinone oxidoreductase subunit NuoF [bacterium]
MAAKDNLKAIFDELDAAKKTPAFRLTVGMATCGLTAGAQPVYDKLNELLAGEDAVVDRVGCIGSCFLEPIVEVFDAQGNRTTYVHMDANKAAEVVERHIKGGEVLREYTVGGPEGCGQDGITSVEDAEFYSVQERVVLRNCGLIDPEDIDQYLLAGGYSALAHVIDDMEPQEVIDVVLESGLRGRGGAGFPTGRKWQFTKNAVSPDGIKYVACNADEGDPGAFMDRSVLESDPHAVVEAMAIAGFAIGASQGYIYVRAEYPIAVRRLQIAIDQAKAKGLLGENILGTGFSFDLGLRLGAGAFVCGEETALLTSIEGHRGEPRPRPPFPANKGLFDEPTVLNNVETWANITYIINNGAAAFKAIGTDDTTGTKVFALGGKIKQAGLVEVAMGTPLRTIIEQVGGGVPNGKEFKAAQTGGPSGGCIPAKHLDTPIDFGSLGAIGSMMGSGGLIVMDEDNCMVDIARFFLDFVVDESCGKCVPCRIGTKRLLGLLDKIIDGKGTPEDLEIIEELCAHLKTSSLCALGQTAPNPVLSTLKHFRNEYEEHVNDKHCGAGVCRQLVTYTINPEICIGCTACVRNCPVFAIVGEAKSPHIIDQLKCIHCGACIDTCRFGAISKG